MVKQWPFIRSYVLKGGHLFLSLMADGGSNPDKRPERNSGYRGIVLI
jgi:hypothetical protein